MAIKQKRIGILTTCTAPWGGSEELWNECVPYLQSAGCEVMVIKASLPTAHPKYKRLLERGVLLFDLIHGSLIARACRKFRTKVNEFFDSKSDLPGFVQTSHVRRFTTLLKQQKPALMVISQGINFDGLGYAYACLSEGIPYVIVSHKAVDFYWPMATDRALMRTVFLKAEKCFFVSVHNKRLTEEQFGVRLPKSEVIFNPVKRINYIPYPDLADGYRICCIGRLFVLDKGQDMLIRVMSKRIWKKRSIHVMLAGSGIDEVGLKEMADLLDVKNITFMGHMANPRELWERCHALILPSRSEGLPLVIAEAMMAGRPVIATNAGGNAEFLEEGITGFIGHADEEGVEAVLERAWGQRELWGEMGKSAAASISQRIPESPEKVFAENLLNLL